MKNNSYFFQLIILILFSFKITYCQEFTSKEFKKMRPILKRSAWNIRGFKKDALISIEKSDLPEIEGLVENALFSGGFEVVSNVVARESLNSSNPLNLTNVNLETFKSVTYKSVYLVTISGTGLYESSKTRSCGMNVNSFTARIVDLANDGKLVGTFKYSGKKKCAEDVANTFVYSLVNSD